MPITVAWTFQRKEIRGASRVSMVFTHDGERLVHKPGTRQRYFSQQHYLRSSCGGEFAPAMFRWISAEPANEVDAMKGGVERSSSVGGKGAVYSPPRPSLLRPYPPVLSKAYGVDCGLTLPPFAVELNCNS